MNDLLASGSEDVIARVLKTMKDVPTAALVAVALVHV